MIAQTAQEIYDSLIEQGYDAAQIVAATCDGEALGAIGITEQETAEDLYAIAKNNDNQ
jgi:uncharacterized protein YebE (UPF0316 family)